MTEEKKKHFFYLSIGYLGTFLIVVAYLRYIFLEDTFGELTTFIGLMCFLSFLRFTEPLILTTKKEKRIFRVILQTVLIITLVVGLFLILGF